MVPLRSAAIFGKQIPSVFQTLGGFLRVPRERIFGISPNFSAGGANFRPAGEWTECATMLHFCSICRLGVSLCYGGLFRHFGDLTTDFRPKRARKGAISASLSRRSDAKMRHLSHRRLSTFSGISGSRRKFHRIYLPRARASSRGSSSDLTRPFYAPPPPASTQGRVGCPSSWACRPGVRGPAACARRAPDAPRDSRRPWRAGARPVPPSCVRSRPRRSDDRAGFGCARKNACKGPGALAAAQAASTSIARACDRPILLIRPCWAKPSPDCRTRGLRPK